MGLFDKMFEKKTCAICHKDLGVFGKTKLTDGYICKECGKGLSPWFNNAGRSSIADIEGQLAYREENKKAVSEFHTTRSFGTGTKVLLDEDAGKFVVTRASDLIKANPDVLEYAQVTGCDIDVREQKSEEKTKDKDGKTVSYNPPRYHFSYNFYIMIRVNHPYFNEIKFQLNSSSIGINPSNAVPETRKPNPELNQDYRECEAMAKEIKEALTGARQQARDEAASAAAPKVAVTCPHCNASTIPDANGCCEYCGGAIG